LIPQALGLPILVRDVPGGALVTMPRANGLDDVPAAHRTWDVNSLPQAQISPGSPAECLGSAGRYKTICKLVVDVSDQRAIV